jgi:hypothetical protein
MVKLHSTDPDKAPYNMYVPVPDRILLSNIRTNIQSRFIEVLSGTVEFTGWEHLPFQNFITLEVYPQLNEDQITIGKGTQLIIIVPFNEKAYKASIATPIKASKEDSDKNTTNEKEDLPLDKKRIVNIAVQDIPAPPVFY